MPLLTPYMLHSVETYPKYVDGNVHLGQFHLGLSFQLCRSAMLDIESIYDVDDGTIERKKRLFWSLQLLEQSYGRQEGLLSVSTDIWRPTYSSAGRNQMDLDSTAPPLPRDDLGTSTSSEPGIWNTTVYLGWVWSQVRKYVSDCAHNILKEPWRHDSVYAKVLSDFMETENRIPMCHRYDSVKFFERRMEEVKLNRDYWAPWLKEQFTYHAIPTVLNHPFLYIVGAQHNPNLGIPNTFWRRSSEQALLHATWIVRMIDMVVDKQVPLVDPFFGHVAAIAATVHLYYCCAIATKLKRKSNTDFAKCRRFLKSFIPCSAACAALVSYRTSPTIKISRNTPDSLLLGSQSRQADAHCRRLREYGRRRLDAVQNLSQRSLDVGSSPVQLYNQLTENANSWPARFFSCPRRRPGRRGRERYTGSHRCHIPRNYDQYGRWGARSPDFVIQTSLLFRGWFFARDSFRLADCRADRQPYLQHHTMAICGFVTAC